MRHDEYVLPAPRSWYVVPPAEAYCAQCTGPGLTVASSTFKYGPCRGTRRPVSDRHEQH